MAGSDVVIRGAREHNLRDVSLSLPRGRLISLTGVSGSGKSSLAFDTLYAEGQRRYVESLSSYARQFLGQMEKPKYETIRGLSPTISIEQKTASSRSLCSPFRCRAKGAKIVMVSPGVPASRERTMASAV
jgi:excinuclease ABC subunit A